MEVAENFASISSCESIVQWFSLDVTSACLHFVDCSKRFDVRRSALKSASIHPRSYFQITRTKRESVRASVGGKTVQRSGARLKKTAPQPASKKVRRIPAEVGILCGGPDWPTSVLCGFLKQSRFEIDRAKL